MERSKNPFFKGEKWSLSIYVMIQKNHLKSNIFAYGNGHILPPLLKATGGARGKKKHVDLIWKIQSLWCQLFLRNVKILLRSEAIGVSMCWPFDFPIVILGVIFDIFDTSFGYKNWNIETNTSKLCINVHFNGSFWLKYFNLEIFVNLGWFWLI